MFKTILSVKHFVFLNVLKTFKYKLKPNKSQRITFAQWLGSCRYLYNVALEHRITAWQSGRKSVSEFDQNMELPKCKKLEGFEWLANVQSQVLQDVIKRVEVSSDDKFQNRE